MFDTDHKFPDCVTLKIVMVLVTCAIKDDAKFYPQNIFRRSIMNTNSAKYFLKGLKKISKELIPIA